jgi:hypothetical protein
MQTRSIKGNSAIEIQSALAEVMADGFRPTLAILFISVAQDRKPVVELFKANHMDVFGATSCGEFINGHASEGAMAVLLLDVSRQHFTVLLESAENSSPESAASRIAERAMQQFQHPTFLLTCNGITPNGEYFDGDRVVSTLVEKLGDEKIFFGGMAGDDWALRGSYIFTHEQESGNGMAALVFNADKIKLEGMAIHGWKPLGILRKVTKSTGNLLYSIDDKPAVEL